MSEIRKVKTAVIGCGMISNIYLRNLKNLLGRAEMTSQEVNTFHGLITALTGKKNRE